MPEPGIPTGPTLNPDTANNIPPKAKLQFLTGIGGHGNLRPLQSQIVSFFLKQLAHSDAEPILPPPPAPGASPFALPANLPKDAFQVTSTGQVSTSFQSAETVFSLNLAHAKTLPQPRPLPIAALRQKIHQITGFTGHFDVALAPQMPLGMAVLQSEFESVIPSTPGRHPAVVLFGDVPDKPHTTNRAIFRIHALPYPSGSEESKSPLLGTSYLLGLRAELTGRTLLGLRVDQLISKINDIATNQAIDPTNITAEASGHEALVLLHAAILDPRLKHITLTHLPPSYRELLANPCPPTPRRTSCPGVLLHYDTPDLIRALGSRVTIFAVMKTGYKDVTNSWQPRAGQRYVCLATENAGHPQRSSAL